MKSSTNFRITMGALVFVFVAGVVLLSTFGKEILKDMCNSDVAIEYTDLGRQATQKRDYVEAERMYRQAIVEARAAKAPDAAVAFAMLTYAEFLKKMKRLDEASNMEAQAHELQSTQ